MAEESNNLRAQGTAGHEKELVTVEVSKASFNKYNQDFVGIPKTIPVYYTQEECDEFNAELEGALNSTDELTVEEAAAYNAAIPGSEKQAGETLTDEEARAYNATLEGAITTEDIKTPAAKQSVRQYLDNNFYNKAQIDAKRSPSYNKATKCITFPSTAAFQYNKSTKTIIISQ